MTTITTNFIYCHKWPIHGRFFKICGNIVSRKKTLLKLIFVSYFIYFHSFTEKKETGVKRKSVADNGDAVEKTTPEKKAKVADEAPVAEAEEAAA